MVRALFTDSSGNMYVFSDCSYDCHVAPHRAASYGLDGLERPGRWTEPTYDGEKSATVSAIWDDVLFLDSYDQSQLIDARTGEPLHELPFASRAPAVMRGSLGFVAGLGLRPCTRDDGWCPSGSTPAAQKRLFGFDVATGHSSWSAELPERTLAGPLLTARDSVLIASADATCGARLHEFSLGGVQLNTWILPPAAGATLHPRWGPFEAEHVAALGPNLLVIGTDSEVPGYGHETAQLVAFELPGISPAEEGWISESGNMGRDGRPR